MGIYIPANNKKLTSISAADRANNVKVLSGASPQDLSTDGVFFLEEISVASGQTVIVKDGKGNEAFTIIGPDVFSNDQSPLRLDYGIILTGTVARAKGFHMYGVLGS